MHDVVCEFRAQKQLVQTYLRQEIIWQMSVSEQVGAAAADI